ncbi:ShlB/FhaC/HecB family hemolysin secretion/activation protein [Sphingomonas sp. BIUV-7]|uniref:ShlB/FhaC/HecB family hemolysin secretion/activation protein n=1 Tax=Sphingomonas natans TaxID=3063330 RepID=A0ABT8YB22_9SPHN|nr:ShlB/FhaC/HecB family hemolysin secretion/activation protein [Sphingomonas sp. BIUV-7]MDO6415531.1 ShlB/FhaC/HecB family hemolysin secretion/activation protein [Sphingomonas sp. BIUV-7]
MRRDGGVWRKRIGSGAAALVASASVAPVQAQSIPTAPTREAIQRAAPIEEGAAPPSKLTVDGGIERAPCPLAEPRFAGVTVDFKGAVFDNLKGLTPEDLASAYADFVGKKVPIAAICDVRDAAATILRRAGYIAAVQVPPQRIADGIVHFDVLMAKLVRVQVRGDAGHSEKLLAAYLDKLTAQPLFNEKEAERYLLLARDLPGYDVRLTLRPAGTAPGEVVGEVIASRIPYVVTANLQNYGSHQVGRWGGLITGQANDLLGFGDRLTLGLFQSLQTREQTVLQSGYDIRVGGEGLTIGGRFTYAWTRPSVGQGDPLKSKTLVASLEASYPLRRSQASNIRLSGGGDLVNQDLRFNDVLLTRDNLRAAYLQLDMDATDPHSITGGGGYSSILPRWRVSGTFEVRRGLGIFGASEDCGAAPLYTSCAAGVSLSRIQADPTATVVRFTGFGEVRPRPNIGIAFSPRLQYGFSPLMSYEQYSGGAYTIGRGYDPGAIIGDSGAGFSIEGRYGTLLPRSRTSFAFQPYAFFDAAWVWNRRTLVAENDPLKLYSIGGGLRIAYGDRGRLDITAATPLKKAPNDLQRGDTRVMVSLTTRLIPWGR